MKIRNGFVSNSSSSSFMVGLPRGLSDKEKREFLLNKMGVDKNSFFYVAAKGVADCIINSTPMKDAKALIDDYGYNSVEDMREDYPDWVELFEDSRQLEIYAGSASNEDYDLGEQLFCEMEWKVSDDDFYINKEAGF